MRGTESALDGRTLGRLDRWRTARALFVRPDGVEAERAVALAFGRRWSRAQVYGRTRRLLLESEPETFLEGMQERLGALADRVRVAPEDPRQTKWDAVGSLTPISRAQSEVRALWFADVLRAGDFFAEFQPIVDLKDGRTLGYEGLLRGRADSSSFPSAAMFPAAKALRVERPFERLSWSRVLAAARQLPEGSRLFLNVNPQLLARDPDGLAPLWEELDESSFPAGRLVLDLVEVEAVEFLPGLSPALAEARKRGVAVALDDMTSGYKAIKCCEAFQPEWAKVDCEITRGVARDPRRRSILKFLARLSRHFSFGLIAEGVEAAEDLDVCAAAGVSAAQGYFLGRPAAEPPPPAPEFLEWLSSKGTDFAPRDENENGADDGENGELGDAS